MAASTPDGSPEDWTFNRDDPENARPIAIYVDAAGPAAMVTESTRPGSNIWADWSESERAQVEFFFAAGLEQLTVEPNEKGVLFSPDQRAAAVLQSVLAELAEDGVISTATADTGLEEARYDNRDPQWVRSAYGAIRHKLGRGKFEWVQPSDKPETIPNDCRLAILGDWGSGRYGAPRCAESIAGDAAGFDLIVHLGDVYYSGTKREVKRNFLGAWPWGTRTPAGRAPGTEVIFRACNSNHEMYSGGKPYLHLAAAQFGQPSSAWALQNDHWLLVGLDTAYDEWELGQGQVLWLRRLLEGCGDRRAILFSHHQPFSHLASPDQDFVRAVDGVMANYRAKIHAWYWGHEHLAAIYDLHQPWGLHGRCIGHSGFPYFRDKTVKGLPHTPALDVTDGVALVNLPAGRAPAAVVLDGANRFIGDDLDQQARYGPNGYLTVDIMDKTLGETLRSPDGVALWQGEI